MADFTLSQIGEVGLSGPSPEQAVQQPNPVSAGLSFASSLFQAHAAGAPGRAAQAEAAQEDAAARATARFTRQQLSIAEAVDTGELSSQEARMRLRANLSAALADNPTLGKGLAKAHADVLSTAGMGKVAAEGTEQEQAFFKVQDAAMKNGWITSSMDQEDAREATFAFMQFQREQEKIKAEQNEVSLLRARVGLQADRVGLGTAQINQQRARLNLQQEQSKVRIQQGLGNMAGTALTRMRTKGNDLRKRIAAGEIGVEEAVALWDNEWLGVSTALKDPSMAEAGSEYVSNLLSPSEDVYEAYRKVMTGEANTEVLEAVSNNAIAKQVAAMNGDPEIVRLAAVSQVFGESASLVTRGASLQSVTRFLEGNSSEEDSPIDLTNPANAQTSKDYLLMLKDSVSKVNSGTSIRDPEALNQEVKANFNNVLKGVEDYGNLVKNPAQLNSVFQFLASDDAGRYVENNGNLINTQNLQGAQNVIDAQFDEVIKPLIREEWKKAQVTTSVLPKSNLLGTEGRSEDVSSLIKPTFSNGGLRFVLADDVNSTPRITAKIKQLNDKVAPVVSRFVRLGAHLEAHRDYQRIYERSFASLFGEDDGGEE